jgi:hypothetical protein
MTREDGHNSSSSTNAAPRVATPESKGRTDGAAAAMREHTYISSFMIGISFKKGSKVADLQPAIQVPPLVTPQHWRYPPDCKRLLSLGI